MEKYQSDYKKPKWTFYFYKNFKFVLIPKTDKLKQLKWKDVFNSPRCEAAPFIRIKWLWFVYSAIQGDDKQWEQWLWVHFYNDGDVEVAKKKWEWFDNETKKYNWDDTFGK